MYTWVAGKNVICTRQTVCHQHRRLVDTFRDTTDLANSNTVYTIFKPQTLSVLEDFFTLEQFIEPTSQKRQSWPELRCCEGKCHDEGNKLNERP